MKIKNVDKKSDAVSVLRDAAVIISKGWKYGEGSHYEKLCNKIAEDLHNSKLPEEVRFEISQRGGSVSLITNGKAIKLHSIFYDTFSGSCYGNCGRYCDEYYREFSIRLKVAEEFLSFK
ncbi:hypothetical protein KKC45_00855 [Patescibacteria group bacterium]|nr:hypothetical protein [Patescibacteria group bacterium]